MTKFSEWILNPGTAGPSIVEGMRRLGIPRPQSTEAQARAGTDTTTDMSPLRVTQNLASQLPSVPFTPTVPLSTPTAIPVSDILEFFGRPEMFGATGEIDGGDDTEAFDKTAARFPFVLLTPGRTYKLGDWVPPSGCTILSHRGIGNYSSIPGLPPVVRRRNGSGVIAVIDTRGQREIAFRGFHIKGASVDGSSVREAHGIRPGGYIISLEDMVIYECNHAYGSDISGDAGQNTQILRCTFGNNITGLSRLVDTTVLGSRVIANKSDGISLGAGHNFNTIQARVEFNGDGGGTYTDGHNIRVTNAEDCIFDVTCDRGWLSGIRALGLKKSIIRGVFRRNGASGAGFEGRSHIYMRECDNVLVDIVTGAAAINDDGSGATAPLYGVHLDNQGAGNSNVTFTGSLSGYVTAPVLRSNGESRTVNMVASASTNQQLEAVLFRHAKTLSYIGETSNLAPAASGVLSVVLPSVPTTTHRPYTLKVTVRNSAITANAWHAEFPMILQRGATGSALVVTFGPAYGQVDTSGGSGYITVAGAGSINLTLGTVVSDASTETLPFTVTNNSATLTHRVFVEIV